MHCPPINISPNMDDTSCVAHVRGSAGERTQNCRQSRRTCRKRSMNPTYSKIGGTLGEAMLASSSKVARLRNLQPRLPVAGVQVSGAATHRAFGRLL